MQRQDWSAFEHVRSQSFVRGLVGSARDVSPDMLVAMQDYRKDERIAQCGGTDPLRIVLAYAQDCLIYDAMGHIVPADSARHARTPRAQRVNVFGQAYRADAQFLLHHTLADIVIGAAVQLYQTHGWTTVLYDGLRTVDGAFLLYNFATDADLAAGLLALPGQSAHNKGLAVDSMMIDASGFEVDMGGHFDHLDMSTNGRNYNGDKISAAAKKNRLIREAAFLRSAFAQGLLVAPLRGEFWDDRLPENREDLWRVLESAARAIGLTFPENRAAYERWSYEDFLEQWTKFFRGHEEKLQEIVGITSPPAQEKPEFYHGNYHPIYDAQLRESGKHLTATRG